MFWRDVVSFAKLIGILVIIFSITSTLCTSYYGVIYWWQGYFKSPMAMHEMDNAKSNIMMDKQGTS
ncbi:MAG: hypothetical protein ACD_45C00631G0002 [uncultured bacterium]|nr:MAG: hypothetical protein ACD_45C00631G0002 [uncultured bacterium]